MSEEKPVALITGGGTGIGAACCRAFAEAGHCVAVHHRSSGAAAEKLAAELPDALAVRADLGEPEEIDAMIANLRDTTGRVDVLVNNAGLTIDGPTPVMKLEAYDAVAALTRGTWYLTKMVLRRFMLRRGTGSIVNVSSVVGHTGNRGQAPYTMAKAALDAFTKSLAQELAGREIRVNSVAPGFIDTAMTEALPPEARDWILSRVPLGRMGRPEEVAEAVVWLATRASYVHGTVLHVNGGMYGG